MDHFSNPARGRIVTSTTNSTSHSLVERAKCHDPESWQRLTQLYGPMVFQWARRHGVEAHDAADIVQTVFATLARSLVSFRTNGEACSFRGWLWTITRNKVRDLWRERERQPHAVGGTEMMRKMSEVPDQAPDPNTDSHERYQLNAVIRRALDLVRSEFEDRTWTAFWEFTIAGRSSSEVGHQLGMSVNSVRQAKSRVLRRLRSELIDLSSDFPDL